MTLIAGDGGGHSGWSLVAAWGLDGMACASGGSGARLRWRPGSIRGVGEMRWCHWVHSEGHCGTGGESNNLERENGSRRSGFGERGITMVGVLMHDAQYAEEIWEELGGSRGRMLEAGMVQVGRWCRQSM